jgi:mannose-1-phosphate guanylyltransferase
MAAVVTAAVEAGRRSGKSFYPDRSLFSNITPESIDFAVMENTNRAAVVMIRCGWSDVGDWRSLHRVRGKDDAGNSVRGRAELLDCRDVLVETDGPKVHAVGLSGVIIVVDGDDILVTTTDDAGQVARLGGAKRS